MSSSILDNHSAQTHFIGSMSKLLLGEHIFNKNNISGLSIPTRRLSKKRMADPSTKTNKPYEHTLFGKGVDLLSMIK